MIEGVVGKAVIQQAGGVLKALGGGGGLHHHGDELHAVPLGGGGHAVLGGGGEARFQAGGPVVEADQAVGVGEAEGAVSDGVGPDSRVLLNIRVAEDQLPGHEGNVPGGGEVAGGGETGAVDKVGVRHAQGLGLLVHLVHEGGLAARQALGQGHGAVVARDHGHALDKVGDRELLPSFK